MNWYPTKQRRGVVELEGGYEPRPVPPGFVPPPPSNVPRVLIEEPAEGWWQQSGTFGFRFQGETPDLEGEVIPLFQNQTLPGPPAPWWVQFFRFDRNLSDEFTPTPNGDLRGRVTYGVGGSSNVIEVDLLQGLQFPVVANRIQIDLVTYAPELANPYNPIGVTAGGMIGKGAGSGALPPTWTTQIQGLPGVTTDYTVTIPDFARSVCLHTTASGIVAGDLATWTLTFISAALNNIRVLHCSDPGVYEALIAEKGVSIPAGTNQINVQGNGLGHRSALQFFLAL